MFLKKKILEREGARPTRSKEKGWFALGNCKINHNFIKQ